MAEKKEVKKTTKVKLNMKAPGPKDTVGYVVISYGNYCKDWVAGEEMYKSAEAAQKDIASWKENDTFVILECKLPLIDNKVPVVKAKVVKVVNKEKEK